MLNAGIEEIEMNFTEVNGYSHSEKNVKEQIIYHEDLIENQSNSLEEINNNSKKLGVTENANMKNAVVHNVNNQDNENQETATNTNEERIEKLMFQNQGNAVQLTNAKIFANNEIYAQKSTSNTIS